MNAKKKNSEDELLEKVTSSEYKYGFTTDIESDTIPKGLSEEVVRIISAKKNEPNWMLKWRMEAQRKSGRSIDFHLFSIGHFRLSYIFSVSSVSPPPVSTRHGPDGGSLKQLSHSPFRMNAIPAINFLTSPDW